MAEIGSEFWDAADTGKKKYLISGRAALEYIIRDILEVHDDVDSVLMPSYCCHTMVEPFSRHGIKIKFYDIYFDEKNGLCARIPDDCSGKPQKEHGMGIFYYMTYFGFSKLSGLDLNEIRNTYDLLIVDRTHSWLSNDTLQAEIETDYTYTSFRKWAGFYGIAEAIKRHGSFIPELGMIGNEYSKRRKEAMLMKGEYIKRQKASEGDESALHISRLEKKEEQKKNYLNKYGDAEDFLEDHYVGDIPTFECVYQLLLADWDYIKERRRKNAKILIQGLRNIVQIKLIYPTLDEEETPLFVPIMVKDDRDGLRKHLINKQIYCPVHWPLSKYHAGLSNLASKIYDEELSLVCDQRYTEEDMDRIVNEIREYFLR